MFGGNRKLKRRNRICRRIAIALTVALLAGQSHAFVLAEENVGDVPQTEISSEEIGADVSSNGNVTDGGNGENANGMEQGGDNGGAIDQTHDDNENKGNPQEGGEDRCVCGMKCAEDAVNVECPVCAVDYAACTGKADDAGNNGSENDDTENNDQENGGQEIPDGSMEGTGVVDCAGKEEEEILEETALENAMDADAGVEVYAVGREVTFDCDGIVYVITGRNEVGVYAQRATNIAGDITIPESVEKGGFTYRVTSISDGAFGGCSGLTSIEIPGSVTSMGDHTFWGCHGLTSIKIPKSVTSIGEFVFYECVSLNNIEIPESVTSIGNGAFRRSGLTSVKIPEGVTSIGAAAFQNCWLLTDIEISKSVTDIGDSAFADCKNLPSITLPENITTIAGMFYFCEKLEYLRIVVPSNREPQLPEVINAESTFEHNPDERYILFVDDSGNELTGKAFTDAFTEAAKNDGDSDDSKWYGWSYKGLSEVKDTCNVTINVKKDRNDWEGHDRTFALSKGGTAFLTDLDAVEAGTYTIYDVTGLTADELRTKGLNTGVSVTVTGEDVSTEVEYYTATFYDGADDYGTGTPQQPQIVLRGQKAVKPADPEKAGWQFDGWKTMDGGSTPYGFDTPVTGTTGIYASWVEKTAEQLHITATATEGGTIFPKDDISVTKGGEQTFTITPDEGNRIKTVTVDDKDVTGELKDTSARAQAGDRYYTFTNVTENHTIRAEFESDGNTPGGGDNPNPGGGGDNPTPGGNGGDNPNPGGGGGTGDNTKPGGGSDTGGNGGGNSGDSGGNSGSGDSAGNGQTAVGSETTSVQAGSGAAGTSAGVNTASDGSKAADGKEPKTGDTAHMEIYATIAMVAGLTYLLLYFMEESRGMTEREKDVFVAAFVRWGKKGGAFRKGCAVMAIFCLLAYYHAIGKRVGQNALNEKYLGQVL